MTAPRLQFFASSAMLAALACLGQASHVQAQIAPDQTAIGTNRALKLPADSPFRDPYIIYLEAYEFINDEAEQVLPRSVKLKAVIKIGHYAPIVSIITLKRAWFWRQAMSR